MDTIASTRRRPAPLPGTLRRIVPALAFAILMAVAILLPETQEWHLAVSKRLSAAAKEGIAQSGIVPLVTAVAAAGLWAAWLIVTTLAIFAAFMAVEILLLGPPRSWRIALFALWVRAAVVLLYYFLEPLFRVGLPWAGLGPLVLIDQAHLPPLLEPIAPILLALLALAAADFGGYWIHRLQHAVPFLWRFHSVHHSIEDLDSLNSYVHPVDAIGERIMAVAIATLIGFEFDAIVWIVAFGHIHDRLLHTRAPIHFGPLAAVFVDNRYHFAHHSIRPEDFDKNFAAMFTWCDRLFGTYRRPHPSILAVTGMAEKHPPRSLWQFATGSLADRVTGPAAAN